MENIANRAAVRQDRRSGGFTLVELLVVIGIIAVLIGILLPSLNRARENARTIACLSNIRQIGMAIQAYAIDNHGYIVPSYKVGGKGESWATVLVFGKYLPFQHFSATAATTDAPYTKTVFYDPSGEADAPDATSNKPLSFTDGNGRRCQRQQSQIFQPGPNNQIVVDNWYGINAVDNSFARYKTPGRKIPDANNLTDFSLVKLTTLRAASEMVIVTDGEPMNLQTTYATTSSTPATRLPARHNRYNATNLGLADGHAATFLRADLPQTIGDFNGGSGTQTDDQRSEVTARLLSKNYPSVRWRYNQQ